MYPINLIEYFNGSIIFFISGSFNCLIKTKESDRIIRKPPKNKKIQNKILSFAGDERIRIKIKKIMKAMELVQEN